MKKIIIFGAAENGEIFLSRIDHHKVQVLCFVDNDKVKQQREFLGYPVIDIKQLHNYDYDYLVIASLSTFPIIEQLISNGIPVYKILPFDYQYHVEKLDRVYQESMEQLISTGQKNKCLRIALLNYNYSNHNGLALYKNMPDYIKEKYHVDLVLKSNHQNLNDYDVICSSNRDGIYDGDHINIELWHGFSLKKKSIMQLDRTEQFYHRERMISRHTDLIMSYSQLHTALYNSCFPTEGKKYRETGMPRNDLLFQKGNRSRLEEITDVKLSDGKILFYLPTWRKGENKRTETSINWNSLFGMPFDQEKFLEFLEVNNLYIFVKLHPHEHQQFKDLSIFSHAHVTLLSEQMLIDYQTHLYEIIGASDLLLTDYSSVYFDMLLLDIPTIFVQPDKEEYLLHRGFLIEPYDYFTPGEKVSSYNSLIQAMKRFLNNEDVYKEERQKLSSLIHKHKDSQSSIRVWQEIDRFLSDTR